MFNNVALDVVIGLVFIYLLYSMLVTIIQEIIANMFSYRAKFLEKAITRMLEDEFDTQKKWWQFGLRINPSARDNTVKNDFAAAFYDQPLIKYLGEKPEKSKPAYLVNATFSTTVIDLLRGQNIIPGEDIRSKIQASLDAGQIALQKAAGPLQIKIKPETLQYLHSIWADAQGDVDRFKELLENWFDETMNRTTGWYKKYMQYISVLIGLVIAIMFNVDTISIAHKLEKDPALRAQIVQQADAYVKAHPNMGEDLKIEKEKAAMEIDAAIAGKKADSVTKNSLLLTANRIADENYLAIKKKGDSLLQQADSLVHADLKKTNEILGLGIGSYKLKTCDDCGFWKTSAVQLWALTRSIFGWLITALALSLGAPFWFDLLNKLMKLRTSVAPASADEKEKKK